MWRGSVKVIIAVTSAQPGETVSTVGVSPRMNQRAAGFVTEGTMDALGTRSP